MGRGPALGIAGPVRRHLVISTESSKHAILQKLSFGNGSRERSKTLVWCSAVNAAARNAFLKKGSTTRVEASLQGQEGSNEESIPRCVELWRQGFVLRIGDDSRCTHGLDVLVAWHPWRCLSTGFSAASAQRYGLSLSRMAKFIVECFVHVELIFGIGPKPTVQPFCSIFFPVDDSVVLT